MVTNERDTKDVMKHVGIDGISESLKGTKLVPTHLYKTSTMLTKKRNETLDLVKIMARDADQANSANNLIKKLYEYTNKICQLVASYYLDKNKNSSSVDIDNKEHSVTISSSFGNTKETIDRLDQVIYSTLLDKQVGLCGESDGFDEYDMAELLKRSLNIGGITPSDIKEEILITVGGDSYKALTRSEISMVDVLPYLDSLIENISNLENLD